MTLPEAIEILRTHNEWRRGAEIPQTYAPKLTEAINTVLSVLSTPTDTARAEDVLREMPRQYRGGSLRFKEEHAIQAMTTYAAPIRAEVERLKGEISVWEELFAKKDHEFECTKSELSAANQRIAEMEEQNKKYWFMIEHGLGVEDMMPPTYPHP